MSAAWVPPGRSYHLRVFVISLVLVVLCLAGFLFGVHMEAKVPATGVITARDLQEVRAPLAGLVELGWYEGEAQGDRDSPVRVRLDGQGNGRCDPASGISEPVVRHVLLEGGRRSGVRGLRFHRLEPGDVLWPGQVLATLRVDDLRDHLRLVEDQLKELESPGERRAALEQERDRLRDRLSRTILTVPEQAESWLAVDVHVRPLQAVRAGDVIGRIVPIDPQTGRPLNLIARLDVEEKHWGDLCLEPAVPRSVRIYSNVHNHRLHGCAEAQIERLEPSGDSGANGERSFRAVAPITQAPYPLPLGSSFKAEIVVGRKLVYRIILEH
jgi:hypothetical protein